jgi:hypothetical protein
MDELETCSSICIAVNSYKEIDNLNYTQTLDFTSSSKQAVNSKHSNNNMFNIKSTDYPKKVTNQEYKKK